MLNAYKFLSEFKPLLTNRLTVATDIYVGNNYQILKKALNERFNKLKY